MNYFNCDNCPVLIVSIGPNRCGSVLFCLIYITRSIGTTKQIRQAVLIDEWAHNKVYLYWHVAVHAGKAYIRDMVFYGTLVLLSGEHKERMMGAYRGPALDRRKISCRTAISLYGLSRRPVYWEPAAAIADVVLLMMVLAWQSQVCLISQSLWWTMEWSRGLIDLHFYWPAAEYPPVHDIAHNFTIDFTLDF